MNDEQFSGKFDEVTDAYESIVYFISESRMETGVCLSALVAVVFNVAYSVDITPKEFSTLLDEMNVSYRKNFEDRNNIPSWGMYE